MGRVFRGYLAALPIACAIVALLPAAASAAPLPSTVSKRVSVSADGVTTSTLRCPGRGLALSGYVSAVSGGAFARDSLPGDLHRWSFRFTANGGSGHARVSVRCLRLKLPKGLKSVTTRVFTTKAVLHPGGGSSALARPSCDKGFLPTGYGIDRSDAGGSAPQLLLTSAVAHSRSWGFRVKNTSAGPQPATIHTRCLGARATGKRGGRSLTEHFKLLRVKASAKVGSGSLTLKCPRGTYALAAGQALPAGDDIFATSSAPSGARGGRFSFRNPSGGKERVRTYLSCLSLRTSFR
jgi:hypothetical protein